MFTNAFIQTNMNIDGLFWASCYYIFWGEKMSWEWCLVNWIYGC